jgi:hypothetical protein
MVLYVVTSVLILLLVAASCLALILGVLGEAGIVDLVRCPTCAHVVVASRDAGEPTCLYCRHNVLAHPLRSLRHPLRGLAHRT